MPVLLSKPYLRIGILTVCIFLVASVVFDLFSSRHSSSSHAPSDPYPVQHAEPIEPPDSNEPLDPASDLAARGVPLLQDLLPKRSRPRSSIGKISMVYGPPEPVYERGLRLHKVHNQRFGYPMFLLREKTLPEYWSKPAYILKVLLGELEKPEATRLQWLMWIDADVVLMNTRIPLEVFVPDDEDHPHIHCIVTNDLHGLNNGVFFLRVHQWSVWLMSAVMGTKIYNPNTYLRFGDQSAMEIQLATDRFKSNTRHVPQRWFNAYAGNRGKPDPLPNVAEKKPGLSSVREGDLLVHFPAHYAIRARRMNIWLNVAEKHKPPWEVPLNETMYIEEISEYWENDVAVEEKSLRDQQIRIQGEQEKAKSAKEHQLLYEKQLQEARKAMEHFERESFDDAED